jgi:DUF971 family protein
MLDRPQLSLADRLRGLVRSATHVASKFAVLLAGINSTSVAVAMHAPVNIQLVGHEVAVAWDDGQESYYAFEALRAASPSASNIGERDILGNQYGGDGPKKFPGVEVVGFDRVGNYAIRFDFSDGHRTGLYSFDYLRKLAGLA